MTKQQLIRNLEWLPYFGAKWKTQRLAAERKATFIERVKRAAGMIEPTTYVSTGLVSALARAVSRNENVGAMKIAPRGVACDFDNPLCENLAEWSEVPQPENVITYEEQLSQRQPSSSASV